MKLSVCLLFLGCLVLVTDAIAEPREEDLQGLLTELKDLVDELEVAEVGMEKRDSPSFLCKNGCYTRFVSCLRGCDSRHGTGKRDEVGLEAEEEVAEVGMEKRDSLVACKDGCYTRYVSCVRGCDSRHGTGKRDEVGLEAEEEELQENAFLA
ncbi:uncharacterized protein LOC144919324 [Branchiostoma floridae x Branchiostoma belcheri]